MPITRARRDSGCRGTKRPRLRHPRRSSPPRPPSASWEISQGKTIYTR
jgi:hypothetical protein